jgi:hypothetical protein
MEEERQWVDMKKNLMKRIHKFLTRKQIKKKKATRQTNVDPKVG